MSWYDGLEHIVRESEPLAPLTWLRLGGTAEYFAEPTSEGELQQLIQRCSSHGLTVRVLGAGSQILVSDQGIKGLVVHLAAPEFCQISVQEDSISAGPGAKLGHVVSTAAREGLGGLESLVGIAGTFAGALKGNADSNGVSIGQWAQEVRIMNRNGTIETWNREQLRFSYRQSNLDVPVVLEGKVRLERRDVAELTRRMQLLWIMKRSNQPSGELGHSRMFLDVQGVSAAELIEQAGLKGTLVGAASISEVNGNYVVANPGTTSQNVSDLMDFVEKKVLDELGVTLTRELQIW
jgi:UDP-N-acetylmuramate dehydrogenase